MDQENTQQAAEALMGLIESINKSAVAFDEHGNELDESQKKVRARQAAIDSAAKQREAEQNAAIQKYKEKVKKQTEVVAGSINAFTNFGKSIASSPGSFGALNSVVGLATKAFSALASKIPFVGGAIAGVGEAAGEAAKMMIESFEKAYSNFEQLTDVGVVNRFQEMTASADALGLTFGDFQKVMSKNAKELANLGGSAITGRKEFERIAYASADARRNFQKLGISAEEFSDFQLSYIAQQQRYNRGQTKSAQELAEGSQKYIKELDALSKLTGVSRKQLQSEQEARLRDTRYRAGIANLPKETREGIDSFLGQLKQVAPGVEEGMKDLIASGGVPVTEAGKAAMLALEQGGLNVRELVAKLREGGISGYKAFQEISAAAGKAGDKFQHLGSIVGDNILLTKNFVELRELEAKRTNMTEEEYKKQRKEIEETIKAQGDQNSQLAESKTAMYNASKNIEQLATSSTVVTSAMKFMAKGVEWLTEKLYELSGKEMPAHIQARKEERAAEEELSKEKQLAAERDKDIKELEEKRAKGTITIFERMQLAFKYDQRRLQQQVLKDAETKAKESVEKRKLSEKRAGILLEPGAPEPGAPKEDPRVAQLKQQEEGWAAAAKNYAEDLDNLKKQLAKAELDKDQKEIDRLIEQKNQKLKQLENANKQKETATKELSNIEAAKARKEREAKAAAVTGGAGVPGTGSAIAQLKDAGLILKEGDVQTAEGGVDPRVIEIAKKVQAQIPGFKMFTGFNDRYHQEKAPNSQHTKGLAFDFTTVTPPSKEEGQKIVEMLRGMGLDYVVDEYNNPSRQATGGHFHGQLKAYDGGVFKGPKSGYEVQLHGSEAVVPLPDGKSIPVQNVTSTNNLSPMSDNALKLFENMNDKFDTIINLLTRGNSIQDNIARNMA